MRISFLTLAAAQWRILVGGIGYEALKLTARYQYLWLAHCLSQPGLRLQDIATREPGEQPPRMERWQYVAEALA
ncbi:MAG: DUF1385 domain-containing protein [Candidatus Marinimicrobia bacterium]|nr:DUF1385 domain-containing protein [Candidatus Neomarinimicrobiota bacterium]